MHDPSGMLAYTQREAVTHECSVPYTPLTKARDQTMAPSRATSAMVNLR